MNQNRSPAVMQQRAEPHDSLEENWREITGWPGYEVSDLGRVRSWKQRSKGRVWTVDRNQPPRILKSDLRNGYASIILSEKGKKTAHASVHRLVLEAFVGPGGDLHGAHCNGDKSDNRAANLRWATPVENNADKKQHGTHQSGDRAGTAKLTWALVDQIRQRRDQGESVVALSKAFAVCRNTISNITANRTWIRPCRKRLERPEDYA